MTQGFYERLGVHADADGEHIKLAYGRAVAHVLRRREATLAQGGETRQLDLSRTQLDEAWDVLSDPARRRRYDAMLAVARDGVQVADADALWDQVSGAMAHPAIAAAARLVDQVTALGLGPLPAPPRPARPTQARSPEVTLAERVTADFGEPRQVTNPGIGRFGTPRAVSETPSAPPPPPPAVAVHEAPPRPHRPATIQLAPASEPAPAETFPGTDVMPVDGPPTSANEFDDLIAQLGPSGALLQAVRERRGVTLEDLASATRITVRYLEAVESEAFDVLPSTAAFVQGYVRQMARFLELDTSQVVEGYMRRFRGE